MQNLDDPWPLVCTKSSDARDVVGLVGGAYALLTILRKKMAAFIMVAKPIAMQSNSCQRTAIDVIS